MKKFITIFLCNVILLVASFSEVVLKPEIGFTNVSMKNLRYPPYLASIANNMAKDIVEDADINQAIPRIDLSWTPFTVGFSLGTVKTGGFTFLWNNFFSVAGKAKKNAEINNNYLNGYNINAKLIDAEKISIKKGCYYEGQFVFGYTWRLLSEKLHVTAGMGLQLGIGNVGMNLKELITAAKNFNPDEYEADKFSNCIILVNLGVPLQAGVEFYFTKNVGIGITLNDSLTYGISAFTRKAHVKMKDDTEKDIPLPLLPAGFTNTFTLMLGPVFKF